MTESTSASEDDHEPDATRAILRAIGYEIRLAREEKGWSRAQFVRRLPTRIGERTLLSYERGQRNSSLLRYLEVCQALGISASQTLDRALQRARLNLEALVLEVDLVALLTDETPRFPGLARWAHNKVRRLRNRIAVMPPAAVVELADVLGCPPREMASYLAGFVPDRRAPAANLSDHVLGDIEAKLVGATA